MRSRRIAAGALAGLLGLALTSAGLIVAAPAALASTVTGTCADVTYVSEASPNGTFGTGIYMRTRGGTSNREIGLMSCTVSGIPAFSTGVSASLDLYNATGAGTGAHTVQLHNMASSFAEGSVTWNTRPSYDGAVLDSEAVANVGGAYNLNASNVTGNGTFRFAFDSTTLDTAEGWTPADDHSDPAKRPVLTVTYTAPPAPTVPGGTTVPSTMVFREDFDGSSVDTSRWNLNWHGASNSTVTPPSNSLMTNCIDPAQLSVASGDLTITTAQRSCLASNGTTYPWASGSINTDGHFNVAPTAGHPVFIEFRDVEMPPNTDPLLGVVGGCGPNWPAVWLTGQTWPTNGEIDVAECLGDDVCYAYHATATDSNWCPTAWVGTMPATTGNRHSFGVLWETNQFTVFYDGVAKTTRATIEAAAKYIVIDSATSGTKVQAETRKVGAVYAWQD